MIKKNIFSIKTNYPIILPSSSLIRKKMLDKIGINFKVIPSNLDEEKVKVRYSLKSHMFVASMLAEEKAKKISATNKNSCVIGADQLCVFDKKILNKPLTKKKAVKQLLLINGKQHCQINAVSVYLNNLCIGKFNETVKLKMRKLSRKTIEQYVNEDKPLDSCGSYKFERKGKLLFSKVEGSTDAVLGLPTLNLLNILFKKKIISYE